MVRVGGLNESPDDVLERATTYLQSPDAAKPFAYPFYDTYDTRAAETELVDGDLLAPLLLNAAPDLAAYRTLQRWRPALAEGLRGVGDVSRQMPRDGTSSEWPEMDDAVGRLYQPLDEGRGGHVSGTTLSKVLHRKIPEHIPLYDSKIFWAYCSAPVVRITPHPERKLSWVEFMTILTREIRRDMSEPDAAALIEEIRQLASGDGPVTALRAWDIITWQAARNALQENWPAGTT
jgi:hypothetical protein